MKRILSFFFISLFALTISAQRCAVLEFTAGAGISQSDVDGISAIFITYFRPSGYTMVERTQIDKVIDEQGFQRSKMTESQMVRVGKILNVSKIVVGDVNVVMGQYNVDARVINVESGTIAAAEGATFNGTSYRSTMQSIAQKLASKIAITSGGTVSAAPAQQSTPAPKKRSSVEVLYGYLKIFPNELGVFSTVPSAIIAQINKQAQHGYNNWRLPSNEELSLMRANGYLSEGEYMTLEKSQGKVLLVTDGDDYANIQEQEAKAAAAAAAAARKAEEERLAREKRVAELRAQGFVDLGLASGTYWKDKNEEGGFYTYGQALSKFGNQLPTKEQCQELVNSCRWTRRGNGYEVRGPNGNSIFLPFEGYRDCDGSVMCKGSCGDYCTSTPLDSDSVWRLRFSDYSSEIDVDGIFRCLGFSVRLVR